MINIRVLGMTQRGVRGPGEAGKVLPESGRLSLGPTSSWFTRCVPAPVSRPGAVPGVWDTKMGGWTRRLRPQGFLAAREGRPITEAAGWCGEGSVLAVTCRPEPGGRETGKFLSSLERGGSIRGVPKSPSL